MSSDGGGFDVTYTPVNETPGGQLADPSGAQCCNDRICQCLGNSVYRTANATEQIAIALNQKLNKECDVVDKCFDKIYKKLREKLEGPQYSCGKCQSMVAQGMAGTLEYAVRCANVVCDQCDTECSLGDPSTEGKCCKTCGQEKCVCKEGECQPEQEPERQPTHRYRGWCNTATDVVVVRRDNEPSPGEGFTPTPLADTEQVAFEQAQTFCQQAQRKHPEPKDFKLPEYAASVLPFCDIRKLISGDILNVASAAIENFNRTGGLMEIQAAFSDIGAFGVTIDDLASTLWGAVRMFTAMPSAYANLAAQALPQLVGCDNQAFQDALRLRASLQLFEKQSGVNFSDFMLPYEYSMRAACRQQHITPSQAISAYIADSLNRDGLEAIQAIHGICPEDVIFQIDAARSKPVPLQLAMMRRRQLITIPQYHEGMRQLGFLDSDSADKQFVLTEQIPTLGDITRLMVRDADDETIPDWPDSDRIFKQKYGKQLRQWAEWQGIPEQFAKYYWRAHWDIPSPGQLFEFYHRLRKDPKYWTDKGALADIEQALIQQDILPRWHKHFIATSFRPLSRIDVRRAFNSGSLSEAELLEANTFLGYSDENAKKLVKFGKALRQNAAYSHKAVRLWLQFAIDRTEAHKRMTTAGLPSALVDQVLDDVAIRFKTNDYSQAFQRGLLDGTEFTNILTKHGVPAATITQIMQQLSAKRTTHQALIDYSVGVLDRPTAHSEMTTDGILSAMASKMLDHTDRELHRKWVSNCQNGIKRRYLVGEIDSKDARQQLQANGTDQKRAAELVSWWGCELKTGEKQISASKLCSLLAQGAIMPDDFKQRMERIGYDSIDAELMLEDCLTTISTKRLQQAQREARQTAQAQRRTARLLLQQERYTQAEQTKLQNRQEKAAHTRQTRERKLLAISDKINSKCGCELYDAYTTAREVVNWVRDNKGLTIDRSLQAVTSAVADWSSGVLADIQPLAGEIADSLIAADISGEPPQLVIPPSSNGSTHPAAST